MKINPAQMLQTGGKEKGFQYPGLRLEPAKIRCLMINEVVPADPADDFYGGKPEPEYLQTTLPLFRQAGIEVASAAAILKLGIYLTNAVKKPKTAYTVSPEDFDASLPILEREIDLFPRLQAVMLMGDVAKKAFNRIARKRTGRNVIPAGSTYKLRHQEFFYGEIRVFPSYIMTGGNLLIEKSKFAMAAEDIGQMLQLLK